jgi:hypothetical protein
MKLEAVLGIDTLSTLIKQLLPLQIFLGEESGSERYLFLQDPEQIVLVPGAGLRATCKARLSFPVLGLKFPIALNRLTVLLRPMIATRQEGEALVFQVEIQQMDLAGFPALLDLHLAERINRVLADRRVELVWDFTRTLSHSLALPPMLGLIEAFHLRVLDGKVDVDESTMRLAIAFGAHFTRSESQ